MFGRLKSIVHGAHIWHGVAMLLILVASTTALAGYGPSIAHLLASTGAVPDDQEAVLFLTPQSTSSLELGETTDIEVRINARRAINSLGATIKYSADEIDVVGFSKQQSFLDLWTEETIINNKTGEVHFSGGTVTQGGISGVGNVVTLTVRALKPGEATLYFESAEIYGADGSGIPLRTKTHALTYTVQATSTDAQGGESASSGTSHGGAVNADFNGDGKVSVVDLSILAFQVVSEYNPRYDLDRNGSISLTDFSIFFTALRQ